MSINPIELLKQKVSSVIVNDQTCLVNEKNAILSRFYPILLSRFLANPELIDQLKEKLRPCLSDLLENNNQVINSLLIHLAAGKLSVTEVETTLNRAIPKSLAVLSAEVGHEAIYIIHYLREHTGLKNVMWTVRCCHKRLSMILLKKTWKPIKSRHDTGMMQCASKIRICNIRNVLSSVLLSVWFT